MDPFETKLDILLDALTKKKEALEQILGITENQGMLLESDQDPEEIRYYLREMNEEKQRLIDEVLICDGAFEKIFSELPEFEARATAYKPVVKQMQEMIKVVMDLDVKIRILENKSKSYAYKIKTKPVIHTPKTSRRDLLKEYEKNARKTT